MGALAAVLSKMIKTAWNVNLNAAAEMPAALLSFARG